MKNAARLTASLLVRKGEATPAVIPEVRAARFPAAARQQVPVPPLARRKAKAAPADEAVSPDSKAADRVAGKRIAMTLRLDAERHLRLKLLAAHERKSCQVLLLEALDALVDRHLAETGDCSCLHDGKGKSGSHNGSVAGRRVRA
ncbi:MAG: hypothetical protein ACE5ED_01755 [Rhodothalassiaceae bacterium]